MVNGFQVVKDFEQALCDYTGAKYAVTTNSCTMALLLAMEAMGVTGGMVVSCPRRTYVGVPMAIARLRAKIRWTNEEWQHRGEYRLDPVPVWDAARLFTAGMYRKTTLQCLSFHWTKTLGIQQGGAILLDDKRLADQLRRARFDGRTEGIAVAEDTITEMGWHCYMSPETAAAGLVRMMHISPENDPLPEANYPDCSTMPVFKGRTAP